MNEALLFVGIFMILFGFIAILAYALLNAFSQSPANSASGKASVGGVVMIGPFPIIFGNSTGSVLLAEILAIVLMVVMLVIFLLFRFRII
ncbi:MAG: TIGR00304 family membrane protein [Candidatus Micrarchaeia archaeon]